MKGIDLDSHSRPRTEDYVIEPEYSYLRPRSYADAKSNRREVFNNKIVSVRTRGELTIAGEHGKSEWRAANYDGHIRYKQVSAAGIDFQFVSAGTVGEFNYVDDKTGAACCRAANDFLYKAFMKPYPRTFTGLPQLPLQDIPEATKELDRCVKDLGCGLFLCQPTGTRHGRSALVEFLGQSEEGVGDQRHCCPYRQFGGSVGRKRAAYGSWS